MDTRKADLNQLRQELRVSKNAEQRRLIREAGEKISKESRLVRSMRKRLVEEHRKGRMENVKDIHAYIEGKDKYKNE